MCHCWLQSPNLSLLWTLPPAPLTLALVASRSLLASRSCPCWPVSAPHLLSLSRGVSATRRPAFSGQAPSFFPEEHVCHSFTPSPALLCTQPLGLLQGHALSPGPSSPLHIQHSSPAARVASVPAHGPLQVLRTPLHSSRPSPLPTPPESPLPPQTPPSKKNRG